MVQCESHMHCVVYPVARSVEHYDGNVAACPASSYYTNPPFLLFFFAAFASLMVHVSVKIYFGLILALKNLNNSIVEATELLKTCNSKLDAILAQMNPERKEGSKRLRELPSPVTLKF